MSLKEKIQNDFKEAFKSRDEFKLGVLKILKAEIGNAEIAKRAELSEEEILSVLSRETKKRKDAIELYEKGGRNELAEKEKKEIKILLVYMPEQMSEEEIRKLVEVAIKETGASNVKEMGKVMGVLSPKIKGRADGAVVSRIVKKLLS